MFCTAVTVLMMLPPPPPAATSTLPHPLPELLLLLLMVRMELRVEEILLGEGLDGGRPEEEERPSGKKDGSRNRERYCYGLSIFLPLLFNHLYEESR